MRIPKSTPFVLFQFAGEHAGHVMFRPVPTKNSRTHFWDNVDALSLRLRIEDHRSNVIITGTNKPPAPFIRGVSCVMYRSTADTARVEIWTGLAEERLSELCHIFGDWMAGAKCPHD